MYWVAWEGPKTAYSSPRAAPAPWLANRRRAATADPVMNFLVRLGDNGVLWNVLSHWPPPRR